MGALFCNDCLALLARTAGLCIRTLQDLWSLDISKAKFRSVLQTSDRVGSLTKERLHASDDNLDANPSVPLVQFLHHVHVLHLLCFFCGSRLLTCDSTSQQFELISSRKKRKDFLLWFLLRAVLQIEKIITALELGKKTYFIVW